MVSRRYLRRLRSGRNSPAAGAQLTTVSRRQSGGRGRSGAVQPGRTRGRRQLKTGSVRIVGGRWRGRRIAFPLDPRTRPMKDRVRQAIFNLLGERVEGTHAIDLFAGTGVLGLEALSRGALRATFFEQHVPTARRLRETAARLGAEGAQIHVADTLAWMAQPRNLQALAQADLPWLVFCSPPYELYLTCWDRLRPLVEQLMQAAPLGSSFVVEADSRFDVRLLPQADAWDVRPYPPAQVAIWRKQAT